ncbi:LacI family DNA-binding transcriptional regulator [Rhodospirillaceae bacterium SYSU D60014]|uniref:LacI family DNA-binding transcriptional regulator n=1 Tax=Virgifigura deserti TaxID=2268457 RepID=UPI000E670541
MEKTRDQVRMIDVARRAKVGLVTVSRVLNEPGKVAEETRQRVLQAIQEIGYVPNLVAGSLASNRTHVIAAIVPTIGNPVFSETIDAMAQELRGEGYHLLLGNGGHSGREEEGLIAKFLARRPDGLFIHGGRHTPETCAMLRRSGIPIVESGDLRRPEPIDMVVSYSNFAAAEAMTTYLLERNYRRIGFVGRASKENDRSLERQRGFRAAFERLGLEVDPRWILETSLGYREGAEALVALRERTPGLEAVFFAGDVWAAGALYECLRRGWSVPTDIAIAGFDDHAVASQTVPTLTTVRVLRGEIGRRSARLILDRLNGGTVDEPIIDVGFEIIARESA